MCTTYNVLIHRSSLLPAKSQMYATKFRFAPNVTVPAARSVQSILRPRAIPNNFIDLARLMRLPVCLRFIRAPKPKTLFAHRSQSAHGLCPTKMTGIQHFWKAKSEELLHSRGSTTLPIGEHIYLAGGDLPTAQRSPEHLPFTATLPPPQRTMQGTGT